MRQPLFVCVSAMINISISGTLILGWILRKFNLHQSRIYYMKYFIVLLLSICIPLVSIGQKKNSDEEAIKALLEKETKAFFEIDYKNWSDSWNHAPHAFWSFADSTGVNSFSGWDNIDKGFAEYFKTAKPSKAKIDRSDFQIKVYNNSAYVRFKQTVRDDSIRPPQEEVRVLEKIKGQWKIICVTVIAIEKESQPKR